ncbi:heavy-metal-associated domain-containing protein [Achromobacter anxifer]
MSIEFQVADMTCGHCAKTITAAVAQAAPGATVTIDLPTHRVTVAGADDADKIEDAIRDAGYAPVAV